MRAASCEDSLNVISWTADNTGVHSKLLQRVYEGVRFGYRLVHFIDKLG